MVVDDLDIVVVVGNVGDFGGTVVVVDNLEIVVVVEKVGDAGVVVEGLDVVVL